MTIYEALGDRDAAVSAAADALVVAPSLASEPLWMSSPAMQAIRSAAMPIAFERVGPEVGYRLALEAGMLDAATEQVSLLPDSSRTAAEPIVAAWNGDESAFEQLHARAIANPLDTGAVAICNRLAARSRDPAWQGPRGWNCDQTPPDSESVIRVGGPPEARVALPGPDATWHHQYVHRRLTPNDELVPGLPHLEARPIGSSSSVPSSGSGSRPRRAGNLHFSAAQRRVSRDPDAEDHDRSRSVSACVGATARLDVRLAGCDVGATYSPLASAPLKTCGLRPTTLTS